MKKYNKTFFILYELKTGEFYDSAHGIDELAFKLGKTRLEMLRSLRTYIKNDTYIKDNKGTKLKLLNEYILEGKKWLIMQILKISTVILKVMQ